MAKDRRGGKNADGTSKIEAPLTEEQREYQSYSVRNPVMEREGIKELVPKPGVKNAQYPLYSNSPNTTYAVLRTDGSAKGIAVYEDYQIQFNIDIGDGSGSRKQEPHYHLWSDGVSRHGKLIRLRDDTERYDFPEDKMRILRIAMEAYPDDFNQNWLKKNKGR